MPMVRERLPTLAAIGPLVDFLFVDELRSSRTLLVPKRWDAATTLEALTAARRVIATVGEVSFEADELEAPLRELAEERGWKAGRPVHGHPRRRHRPDRHAAALRHARGARLRTRAGAARPRSSIARGSRRLRRS